ncbi:MAG: YkgJ family cysteine cluster protein [Bryobacterales bacterium]|nr:YkgJ family cysteine cluster protein [Bryobacteraceae bacterium]MDW8130159.1 YkgJ family cysteine cluster protein [Bryobacterales bacterium]
MPVPERSARGGWRFACVRGCTLCCRQPGFVYLTEQDVRRAARRLGLSAREFERRYVYRTPYTLRLRKPRRAACHFLSDSGCLLHPAKPTQCRLYPFWPEILEEPGGWRREADFCPGIGRGPRLTPRTVRRRLAAMKRAYPAQYS